MLEEQEVGHLREMTMVVKERYERYILPSWGRLQDDNDVTTTRKKFCQGKVILKSLMEQYMEKEIRTLQRKLDLSWENKDYGIQNSNFTRIGDNISETKCVCKELKG